MQKKSLSIKTLVVNFASLMSEILDSSIVALDVHDVSHVLSFESTTVNFESLDRWQQDTIDSRAHTNLKGSTNDLSQLKIPSQYLDSKFSFISERSQLGSAPEIPNTRGRSFPPKPPATAPRPTRHIPRSRKHQTAKKFMHRIFQSRDSGIGDNCSSEINNSSESDLEVPMIIESRQNLNEIQKNTQQSICSESSSATSIKDMKGPVRLDLVQDLACHLPATCSISPNNILSEVEKILSSVPPLQSKELARAVSIGSSPLSARLRADFVHESMPSSPLPVSPPPVAVAVVDASEPSSASLAAVGGSLLERISAPYGQSVAAYLATAGSPAAAGIRAALLATDSESEIAGQQSGAGLWPELVISGLRGLLCRLPDWQASAISDSFGGGGGPLAASVRCELVGRNPHAHSPHPPARGVNRLAGRRPARAAVVKPATAVPEPVDSVLLTEGARLLLRLPNDVSEVLLDGLTKHPFSPVVGLLRVGLAEAAVAKAESDSQIRKSDSAQESPPCSIVDPRNSEREFGVKGALPLAMCIGERLTLQLPDSASREILGSLNVDGSPLAAALRVELAKQGEIGEIGAPLQTFCNSNLAINVAHEISTARAQLDRGNCGIESIDQHHDKRGAAVQIELSEEEGLPCASSTQARTRLLSVVLVHGEKLLVRLAEQEDSSTTQAICSHIQHSSSGLGSALRLKLGLFNERRPYNRIASAGCSDTDVAVLSDLAGRLSRVDTAAVGRALECGSSPLAMAVRSDMTSADVRSPWFISAREAEAGPGVEKQNSDHDCSPKQIQNSVPPLLSASEGLHSRIPAQVTTSVINLLGASESALAASARTSLLSNQDVSGWEVNSDITIGSCNRLISCSRDDYLQKQHLMEACSVSTELIPALEAKMDNADPVSLSGNTVTAAMNDRSQNEISQSISNGELLFANLRSEECTAVSESISSSLSPVSAGLRVHMQVMESSSAEDVQQAQIPDEEQALGQLLQISDVSSVFGTWSCESSTRRDAALGDPAATTRLCSQDTEFSPSDIADKNELLNYLESNDVLKLAQLCPEDISKISKTLLESSSPVSAAVRLHIAAERSSAAKLGQQGGYQSIDSKQTLNVGANQASFESHLYALTWTESDLDKNSALSIVEDLEAVDSPVHGNDSAISTEQLCHLPKKSFAQQCNGSNLEIQLQKHEESLAPKLNSDLEESPNLLRVANINTQHIDDNMNCLQQNTQCNPSPRCQNVLLSPAPLFLKLDTACSSPLSSVQDSASTIPQRCIEIDCLINLKSQILVPEQCPDSLADEKLRVCESLRAISGETPFENHLDGEAQDLLLNLEVDVPQIKPEPSAYSIPLVHLSKSGVGASIFDLFGRGEEVPNHSLTNDSADQLSEFFGQRASPFTTALRDEKSCSNLLDLQTQKESSSQKDINCGEIVLYDSRLKTDDDSHNSTIDVRVSHYDDAGNRSTNLLRQEGEIALSSTIPYENRQKARADCNLSDSDSMVRRDFLAKNETDRLLESLGPEDKNQLAETLKSSESPLSAAMRLDLINSFNWCSEKTSAAEPEPASMLEISDRNDLFIPANHPLAISHLMSESEILIELLHNSDSELLAVVTGESISAISAAIRLESISKLFETETIGCAECSETCDNSCSGEINSKALFNEGSRFTSCLASSDIASISESVKLGSSPVAASVRLQIAGAFLQESILPLKKTDACSTDIQQGSGSNDKLCPRNDAAKDCLVSITTISAPQDPTEWSSIGKASSSIIENDFDILEYTPGPDTKTLQNNDLDHNRTATDTGTKQNSSSEPENLFSSRDQENLVMFRNIDIELADLKFLLNREMMAAGCNSSEGHSSGHSPKLSSNLSASFGHSEILKFSKEKDEDVAQVCSGSVDIVTPGMLNVDNRQLPDPELLETCLQIEKELAELDHLINQEIEFSNKRNLRKSESTMKEDNADCITISSAVTCIPERVAVSQGTCTTTRDHQGDSNRFTLPEESSSEITHANQGDVKANVSHQEPLNTNILALLNTGYELSSILPVEQLLETILAAEHSPIVAVVRKALMSDLDSWKVKLTSVRTHGELLLQNLGKSDSAILLDCIRVSKNSLASCVRELLLIDCGAVFDLDSFLSSLVAEGEILLTQLPDAEAASLIEDFCASVSAVGIGSRVRLKYLRQNSIRLFGASTGEDTVASELECNENLEALIVESAAGEADDPVVPLSIQNSDDSSKLRVELICDIMHDVGNAAPVTESLESSKDLLMDYCSDLVQGDLSIKTIQQSISSRTLDIHNDTKSEVMKSQQVTHMTETNNYAAVDSHNEILVESAHHIDDCVHTCQESEHPVGHDDRNNLASDSTGLANNYDISRLLCSVVPVRTKAKRVAFSELPMFDVNPDKSNEFLSEAISEMSEKSTEESKLLLGNRVSDSLAAITEKPKPKATGAIKRSTSYPPDSSHDEPQANADDFIRDKKDENQGWWSRTPSDEHFSVRRPSLTQEQIEKIAGFYQRTGKNSKLKDYYFGGMPDLKALEAPLQHIKPRETFFCKLHDIVMSGRHTKCVDWAQGGKSILFSDPLAFQNEVIPMYYPGTWRSSCGALSGKSCDFPEVVRIMKAHGFRKCDPHDPDTHEYQHNCFAQGSRQDVYKIKKRGMNIWQFPSPAREVVNLEDTLTKSTLPLKPLSPQVTLQTSMLSTSAKDDKIRTCIKQVTSNLSQRSKSSVSDVVLQLQRRKQDQKIASLMKDPAPTVSHLGSLAKQPAVFLKNLREQGQFNDKLVGIGHILPERGMRVKLSFAGLEHKITLGLQPRSTLVLLRGTIEDMEADFGMCKVRWRTGEEEFCCSGFCGKYYLEVCVLDKMSTDASWWCQQASLAPAWKEVGTDSIWRMDSDKLAGRARQKGGSDKHRDVKGLKILEGAREEVTQYFNRIRAEEARREEEQRAILRGRRGADEVPVQIPVATQIALGATTGSAAEDVGTFFRARGTLSEVVERGEMAALERLLRRAYDSMDPQPSGHVAVREIVFCINRMRVGATKAALKEVVSAHDGGEEELSYGGFLDLMYDLLSRCKVVPASSMRRRSIAANW